MDILEWHKRRYSPEEIKKIQVALNKVSGPWGQLVVDGKFGPATASAIKQYQQSRNGELKVDGLAGDKTLASLGVHIGSGGEALPETRKGAKQSRQEVSQNPEDIRLRKYFNSPEMVEYLTNPANAADETNYEYFNLMTQALPYLDSTTRARVRYINNIGDEYDEDTAKQHNASVKRQLGIANFKSWLASGAGKITDKDLTKYQQEYGLTDYDIQELLADPAVIDSARISTIIQDNGRVNSQQAQARAFQTDVTNEMNRAGVSILNSMSPISEVVYGTAKDIKDGEPMNFLDWINRRVDNTILSGYTGNRPTYLTDVTGSTGNTIVDYGLDMITAPETILMRNTGIGRSSLIKTTKIKPTYWKTTVTPGQVIRPAAQVYPGTLNLGILKSPTVTVSESPITIPAKVAKNGHVAGTIKTPGKLKFNIVDVPGTQLMPIHGVNPYAIQVRELPQIDIPEYDQSVTYGPYQQTNRVQYKTGGKLSYLDYIK